jgi:hypothetical protein
MKDDIHRNIHSNWNLDGPVYGDVQFSKHISQDIGDNFIYMDDYVVNTTNSSN